MARSKLFDALVITCEHATNAIPRPYRGYFRDMSAVLASHRGWDPGALAVARFLGAEFDAPVFAGEVSRLLVDLNRSLHHRSVFSDRARLVSEDERAAILATYYLPYRAEVEAAIARLARRRSVLHLSIHSFTPVLDGEVRNCDAAFLYDPKRPREKKLAIQLQAWLQANVQGLRVRRNYPYVGYSDGFTTYLRRRFGAACYLGLEFEMNQAMSLEAAGAKKLARALAAAVHNCSAGLR